MGMRDEVQATLAALKLDDSDKAASQLALTYAHQLDVAAIVRGQADKTVKRAIRDGDLETIEMVTALRAKLNERDTVDRIGKNLLTLLDALGATPRARAELGKKTGNGGRQAPASSGALARLRSVQ